MKIIRNNILPFTGYKAINILGVLFVRKNALMGSVDINHEAIHSEQIKEMLWVGFYLWYIFEWLYRSVRYWSMDDAYRCMSFEQEAYLYESDMEYIKNRKHFAWLEFV